MVSSTAVEAPIGEVVLRRQIRPWVADAVALLAAYALLATAVSKEIGPGAMTLTLGLGVLVVLIAVVSAVRGRSLTLRPTGLTIGRREVPWSDVFSIHDTHGVRSRYVKVYLTSEKRWRRVRALRTTAFLPGARYQENVRELDRWRATYAPAAQVSLQSRFPGWIYPVVAALVLTFALVRADPVHYWLPEKEAIAAAVPCTDDLTNGVIARSASVPPSPGIGSLYVCRRTGNHQFFAVMVMSLRRLGLLNGSGFAHEVFNQCSYDRDVGGDTSTASVPLADQTSAAQFETMSQSGVYLVARRANVLVFVAYTHKAVDPVPLWTCTPGYVWSGDSYGETINTFHRPDPADLAVATATANQILTGVST